MSSLILKIATSPCVESGRAIYQLGQLPDEGVIKAMMHLQHQKNGTDFLPLNQHRIVAISVVRLREKNAQLFSLGTEQSDEVELLTRLASLFEQSDDVIAWNGSEFDLPVIGHRLLKYGIACPAFWRRDSFTADALEPLDLSDELSAFQGMNTTSLREMAQVLGLPADKSLSLMDLMAEDIRINQPLVRQACEADALNTYLIYLKYLKTSGELSTQDYNHLTTHIEKTL